MSQLLTVLWAWATAVIAPATGVAPQARWEPPTPTPLVVLRAFDPPASRWGTGHRGVDLAVDERQVFAPRDGVVSFAGEVAGRGVVVVSHGELRSTFEPVRSVVPVGTTVRAGQLVAELADPAHCERACVHWGVLRGDDYLDPLSLLMSQRVRLLPLAG